MELIKISIRFNNATRKSFDALTSIFVTEPFIIF